MRKVMYAHTNGVSPDEIEFGPELDDLLRSLGTRLSPDTYTLYRYDEATNSDVPDYEVYEVYGQGETADDYPDGDPYSDTISIPAELAYSD